VESVAPNRRDAITVLRQRHAGDVVTREKLKLLLEEYGRLAIWVYLVLWLSVLAGFAVAISTGFKADSGAAGLGVLGAAWVATKLTQPLRIGATLLLTPAISAVWKKWRARGQPSDPSPPQEQNTTS
jgi:hypothetical protein